MCRTSTNKTMYIGDSILKHRTWCTSSHPHPPRNNHKTTKSSAYKRLTLLLDIFEYCGDAGDAPVFFRRWLAF